MKRRKERAGRRQGVQLVTLCISTSMVLVLLGLVVFSVQTSRNLSQWVKENLTVTVVLNDDVSVDGAKQFCENLYVRPFSKNIDYISREQALKEQTEAMGSDPSEFLGMNPFPATLELQLHSDYANADSLEWISEELRKSTVESLMKDGTIDKVESFLKTHREEVEDAQSNALDAAAA